MAEEKKGTGSVSSKSVKVKEEKLEIEKEVKTAASQVLATQRSSAAQSDSRSSRRLRHALVFYFVNSTTLFLPLSLSFWYI